MQNECVIYFVKYFYAGLGSRSRSERGVFGSLEPEPLEKKQEPGPMPLGKKVRSRSRSF